MKIINQLVVQSDMPNDNNVVWVYKQLSSNDYTTAEKNKLANLQNYTLPTATKNILGGVKAITNIADLDADTATIGQVARVVNNLLAQFRTSGLIQA